MEDGCSAEISFKASITHFDVKLHFGDEQFEVDAAQLAVAFTQMTLRKESSVRARDTLNTSKGNDVVALLKQLIESSSHSQLSHCGQIKVMFGLC